MRRQGRFSFPWMLSCRLWRKNKPRKQMRTSKPKLAKRKLPRSLVPLGLTFLWATAAFAQLNNDIPAEVKGVTVEQNLGAKLPLDLMVVDTRGAEVPLANYFD